MTSPGLAQKSPEATEKHLLLACKEEMRRGSLSFFLAARLLGTKARDAIMMLYAWCRFADDLIDGTAEKLPQEERGGVVDQLRADTARALRCPLTELAQAPLGYRAMGYLGHKYALPAEYPIELTLGMQMDAEGQTYEDVEDLKLYCYRVAGVVGVMFSHIIGVSDDSALPYAANLGIAMQLTNISRDVLEDAAMGRIYLPRHWLREAGVPCDPKVFPQYKKELAVVTGKLLDMADSHYRSGELGLKYLPLRAACAVSAARYIYDGIGDLVRQRGAAAWDQRAVVPFAKKLHLLCRGLWLVIKSLPFRLVHPWQRRMTTQIWRYSACETPPR